MTTIEMLRESLRRSPLDDLTYFALADALEEAGRHCEADRYRRLKPAMPDVVRLFALYYGKPENDAWGSLHVVLDDRNVDDDSVRHCLRWATENGDADGVVLAQLLLRMSKRQRKKISILSMNPFMPRLPEAFDWGDVALTSAQPPVSWDELK